MTPQCGVAICRLALPSPPLSLAPRPVPPVPRRPLCLSSSAVFMRRVPVSVPRSLKEGRGAPTRGTTGEGTKDRGRNGGRRATRGRGPREERLTRRDQRRDSCLRRVSPRRQEGPSRGRERERVRGMERGRESERGTTGDIRSSGGGIRDPGEGKIRAADGPSSASFSFFLDVTRCTLNHSIHTPKNGF